MLKKIKTLSKDTLTYGTNTIIGRFLGFFLVPFYTNKFLPEEYGIIAIIYAYIAILNVCFSIGLESGYMKFASTLEVGNKKENFSNPFIILFLNSFILASILIIFPDTMAYLFQIDVKYSLLIRYTALILFFDSIVLIQFSYLRLNNKAKTFAFIKITNIVVNVLMNVILISYFDMGIEAVFISNLIASVITFIMLIPVLIKNLSFKINRRLIKEVLMFSIPIIPAGIAANIVQTISRPILKYLTNDSVVGIYQASFRLGILMMLIVSMFEFAWRPFFLNNAKEPNAKEMFSKILTLFVMLTSFVFLTASIFIEDIVTLKLPFNIYLIGKAYWDGLSIVPVILFSYLLYGIYVNLMAGIYIEKKTKYLPIITGAGAIASIVFNFILIPKFSYMGAAMASLISYLIMMIGIYFVSQKYYPINYEYKKIGIIFLTLGLITAIYYFLISMTIIPWYAKIIFPLSFLIVIFFSRIINVASLKKLIKA
ncbi:MAG: oligosaccharide flippase family protein [Bacteroidota bacterium]|nr:oligosaccharide flippase family protein [Bacteroidota bacterium]